MAKLHTDLPTAYSGERQLAQTLAALNDPVLHLWFALDYLPGVPDIDCLIWHEEIGVFVIEVKAVPLVAIERLDYKRCKIVDREEGRSPVCQAYEAFWNFRAYLLDRGVRPPFMVSTACWPLIMRSGWHDHFEDADLGGQYSERMLFCEDLATAQALRERLTYIFRNPPRRKGAQHPFRHSMEELDELSNALMPVARARQGEQDLYRLSRIEQGYRIHRNGSLAQEGQKSLQRAVELVSGLADSYARWQAGSPELGRWRSFADAVLGLVDILDKVETVSEEEVGAWAVAQKIESQLAEEIADSRVFGTLSGSLGEIVEEQANEILRQSEQVGQELGRFKTAAEAMAPEERRQAGLDRVFDQFQQIREQLRSDYGLRNRYKEICNVFTQRWEHFLRLRNSLALRVRHRPTLKHLDRLDLNKEQEHLVTMDRPGHYRIQGASGSGKTIVLLHRALQLARERPSSDVRVFTINRSLAELLRNNLLTLNDSIPENVHVEAFYDFLQRCVSLFEREGRYRLIDPRSGERIPIAWSEFFRHRTNVFSEAESKKLVASIEGRSGLKIDASRYLRDEMVYIRSMFRKEDRSQYLDSERPGRSIPLQPAQRKRCLKILSAWEEYLATGDLCDIDGLTSYAAEFFWRSDCLAQIRNSFPTDHILVDEVQDFSTLELSIIRRLVPVDDAPNAFFFVGDLNQKVFPKHHSGTQAGFNFSNRSAQLTRNYRNTQQILEAAYRIVDAHPPKAEEAMHVMRPELSPYQGEKPVVLSLHPAAQANQVLAIIQQRRAARLAVVSENEELLKAVHRLAEQQGNTCFQLFRNEDLDQYRQQASNATSAAVVLSRLEAVKGFEFDTVIACDLSEGVIPRQGVPSEEIWREAAVLYTALPGRETNSS